MNPIDTRALSRANSTGYPLRGDEVDWFTGSARLGSQLLVVYQFPDVVVVSFSQEGHIENLISPPGLPTNEALGFFSAQDDDVLQKWLAQLDFVPGLITVKRFNLPQHHIRIEDLPYHTAQLWLHPELCTHEQRELAQQEIEHWSNQGMFELWLNEHTNIWIDKTGEIVAT